MGSIKTKRNKKPKLVKPYRVTVGVHQSEGAQEHPNGQGYTIANIGEAAEYGRGQPVRSWLRGWFDDRQSHIQSEIKQFAPNPEALALRLEADIKERITNRIDPANAESTIKRKKSDVPLIDQGIFITGIRANVQHD